jgi:hypothetical protein
MPPVRLAVRFSAGKLGINIPPELVGQQFEAQIDGQLVKVSLPARSKRDPYDVTVGPPEGLVLAEFVVEVEAEVSDIERRDAELAPAFGLAVKTATRITDEARRTQPWGGLVGSQPDVVEVFVTDVDTGLVHEVDHPTGVFRSFVWDRDRVTAERIVGALQGGAADLPDVLLAQARYLAHHAPDRQPSLAVVLAAVGCEAKVKTFLLDHAEGRARDLLDVILKENRISHQPAVELFGFVAEAILGLSLRTADRDLFRRVGALFVARNALVHRATAPAVDEAIRHVAAAREAFHWLNTLGQTREALVTMTLKIGPPQPNTAVVNVEAIDRRAPEVATKAADKGGSIRK